MTDKTSDVLRAPSTMTALKVSIGQALWEEGGWADARLKRFLHAIRASIANPRLATQRTRVITNLNPRGLAHLVLPTDLETRDKTTGQVYFVTPCGGVAEGGHWVSDDWQAAIIPTHARAISDCVAKYTNAGDSSEKAALRSQFDDLMLDINLYPNALTTKDQNDPRIEAGLPLLEAPTAKGSHDWAAWVSDTSDTSVMLALREQISGLSQIETIIGAEGSAERQQYINWYAPALRANINNRSNSGTVLSEAQARDVARIICSTLCKGNISLTPRKAPKGEICFLMELDGFARIYEEGQLPATSEGIAAASKHTFGGGHTMIKVVARHIGPAALELHSVRPIDARLVGDAAAAQDPIIQEVVDGPYKHGDLQRITFNDSEVSKRLRFFGSFLPAGLTAMGSKALRRTADQLPATALASTAKVDPKVK